MVADNKPTKNIKFIQTILEDDREYVLNIISNGLQLQKICGNKIHIHIIIQLTISNVNKNCNKYTGVERVGAVFFAETENICNPPNVCQECSQRWPFMITWPTPGPPTNSIYPQNCRSILNLKIYCFTWTYNEDSTIYISKI